MPADRRVQVTVTLNLPGRTPDGCDVATVVGAVRDALEGASRFVTQNPGTLVGLVGTAPGADYPEEVTYRTAFRTGGPVEPDAADVCGDCYGPLSDEDGDLVCIPCAARLAAEDDADEDTPAQAPSDAHRAALGDDAGVLVGTTP